MHVSTFAQQLSMGKWETFLSYYHANSIAFDNDVVYCGSNSGLFSYNSANWQFIKYDKTDGFNGTGVQALGYSTTADALMIVYDDSNIDLLKGDKIINMPQLMDYPIAIEKKVNDIYIKGDTAVLSCNFGIIIFDLKKEIVLVDVQFNTNPSFAALRCQSATLFNNKYYFATSNGIFSVSLNQNIKNLSNWQAETSFPNGFYKRVKSYKNKLYALHSLLLTSNTPNQDAIYISDGNAVVNFNNSLNKTIIDFDIDQNKLALLYPSSLQIFNPNSGQSIETISGCISNPVAVRIKQNQCYIIDNYSGLLMSNDGAANCAWITIPGPPTSKVYDLSYSHGTLWAVSGAISNIFQNTYEGARLYYFKDNTWTEVPLPNSFRDVFKVYSDPKEPGHVFASSWMNGLIEVKNYNEVIIHNAGKLSPFLSGQDTLYRAGGVVYDKDRNLWIPNSNTDWLLKQMKPDGTWFDFSFSSIVPNKSLATLVEVDDRGNLWIAFPDRGVGYFNPKTNQKRLFNTAQNNGELPDLGIKTIKSDKKGQVWVGTRDGFRIFSTSQAEKGGAIKGNPLIIKAADGNNEIVLNQTIINEIEIDDAGRKWIATEGSGIVVISDDGNIEKTYTAANSELLDNNVRALEFDRKSGYLYIATAKGLMALRQEATEADPLQYADLIYAYPNPVKPSWDGPITIKGLAENANIKITDVSGNIVYETRALGGQAVWNGKSYNGQRVQTGVYLVFAINNPGHDNEGIKSMVTKILFIN